MKGLIIGLIIGAAAIWGWYQTDKGKISITETVTVTNTVVKIIEQVRYNDQVRWVTKVETNVVMITNYIERTPPPVVIAAKTVAPTPKVKTSTQRQSEVVNKAPMTARQPSRFGGPVAVSNVSEKYKDGKRVVGHSGVHIKMGQ